MEKPALPARIKTIRVFGAMPCEVDLQICPKAEETFCEKKNVLCRICQGPEMLLFLVILSVFLSYLFYNWAFRGKSYREDRLCIKEIKEKHHV